MIIREDLLLEYGGKYETYYPNETIFSEESLPKFYFQIVNGVVELNNYHEDGKEFTQNILSDGQSIGESLLFNEKSYPMNAIAKTECKLLKVPREDFFSLIGQNRNVMMDMFKCMADRLYYKYLMLFNISSSDPQFKIKTIIDYLKSTQCSDNNQTFQIPYTRQQIANLTGLRVETVIRTVKKMESENMVKIEGRKILY
ncbi:cAMP-binding domain of CRP or a regulatory subunit of cAMP-dependent protein kinases [Chryseobacterium oleae]|uniref:cAMP-binding domain of CRP or a regulatory subunit of cAMP-dependent protein kinases n=2 Tax=Chryseobacterium TaxID=59732 RepID=A0A1I4YSX1_CHROL|nr:Crp/Fnr family transcriptional regulator [Chryseobacterium oleae]SFN41114.1 cAMP-binding domain of CRP or a regulatory subunit of cAMP-dependent protein kinases [Chryseobacterium oleae]